MKNKTYLIILMLLNGCDLQNNTEPKLETKGNGTFTHGYVKYNGPSDRAGIKNTFGEYCDQICTISSDSGMVPLRKLDNTSICVASDSQFKVLFSIYLTTEGDVIGGQCTIKKDDYEKISKNYNINNFYKKYSNQRAIFDEFKTWKTNNGFVTTYREIRVPDREDNNLYKYKLYVGKSEHPGLYID